MPSLSGRSICLQTTTKSYNDETTFLRRARRGTDVGVLNVLGVLWDDDECCGLQGLDFGVVMMVLVGGRHSSGKHGVVEPGPVGRTDNLRADDRL